jgi:homoserine O-acetyltransferase
MRAKFGRRLQDRDAFGYDFGTEFQVESYLRYQGSRFVERFDANSYLYITKAIDYFDLSGDLFIPGKQRVDSRFLVISFSSDWLYPPSQSLDIVRALKRRGIAATYCELKSTWGHDAFLVEVAEETRLIKNFLRSITVTTSPFHRDSQGGLNHETATFPEENRRVS